MRKSIDYLLVVIQWTLMVLLLIIVTPFALAEKVTEILREKNSERMDEAIKSQTEVKPYEKCT